MASGSQNMTTYKAKQLVNTYGGQYIPVWVDNGILKPITGGTTGQFYRGDNTWSNTLTGDLTIGGNVYFTGLGEGLEFIYDNNYFGTNADARIIQMIDGNPGANSSSVDGGLIIRAVGRVSGVDTARELLRIRGTNNDNNWHSGTFQWKGKDIVVETGTSSPTWSISIGGNAATATALTSNAGSGTQPIYFSGGKPTATSYTLNATVNAASVKNTFAYYSGTNAISSYPRIRNIGSARYPMDIYLYNDAGNIVGEIWYDMGNATNVTAGRWNFLSYSPNSTADTGTTGKYEYYMLPQVTAGRSSNASYDILTTKNTLTIAQGGTGATTAASARANLGTWSLISSSYNTFMPANGTTNDWYKFGTADGYGILPALSGGATGGHSYIGTSSWYWKYSYIDEMNAVRLRVVHNSSNTGDDAMVYFENKSSADWGVKINCDGYDYGLQITCKTDASNALKVTGYSVFDGKIYISQPSARRDNGIVGSYDSTKAAAIWSMGSSYQINAAGTSLGSLYGAAYAHTNATSALGSQSFAGGHQFLWCQNGTVYVALGNNLWARSNITAGTDITAGRYLYCSYVNESCGTETPSTSSNWIYANSDGWLRKSTNANVGAALSNQFLHYNGWWTSGSSQHLNNANGMVFAYSNHGHPTHWGIVATFDYQKDSAYRLQLAGGGYDNTLWFRNRSSDRNGWYTGWQRVATISEMKESVMTTFMNDSNTFVPLAHNGNPNAAAYRNYPQIWSTSSGVANTPNNDWATIMNITPCPGTFGFQIAYSWNYGHFYVRGYYANTDSWTAWKQIDN